MAKMLDDPSDNVKMAAMSALGDLALTGAQFGPQVAAKLKSPIPEIKGMAAQTIGKFGPKVSDSVADALGALLDDENDGVRMAAVEAIGAVERVKFAGAIEGKLNDKVSGIRGVAIIS